jgi:Na+/H+ antiporter NhaC
LELKVLEPGWLSLIPALFLVVYMFSTRRILEALAFACLLGHFIVHKAAFFTEFTATLIKVGSSQHMVWLWLVCGLMGSIVALIEKSGGAYAFGQWVAKRAVSGKRVLLWTWFSGWLLFIDDYFNSLLLGSSMAPVTDKNKISREYLSYIVDSTAAPVSVLVPLSTWAVFIAGIIEESGAAEPGQGMAFFIKTIPYNFYAWAAVLMVPLLISGLLPLYKPMKKAQQRAVMTGVLAPPGSEKIDIRAGEEDLRIPENPSMANFILPLLILFSSTLLLKMDLLAGVLITLVFLALLYFAQRLINLTEFMELCILGIKNMLYPLLLMFLAFVFAETNRQSGFIEYIIRLFLPVFTPELFPVILFIILSLVEFASGTNWGMYLLVLPQVLPLAVEIGADPVLTAAAVLSAGVFGSHSCFFSDATVLTSAACGCDNYRHAVSQLPYGLLAGLAAAAAFAIAGFASV